MKTTLSIIALSVLLFTGCTPITKEIARQLEVYYVNTEVFEFDSCEYVVVRVDGNKFGIAHKGNCKYCEQRRREEQK